MTGHGNQGGPPRRDVWRGDRRDSRGSNARPEPVSSRVEVEELATQSLVPRSRSRLPLTGALAAAGLAILLAAGFGLLGGRAGAPASTPAASQAVDGPSRAPTNTPAPIEPRVSPWAPCGGASDQLPEPVLGVDGQEHFGSVEVSDRRGAPLVIGPSADAITDELDAVEIRMDSAAEIWITGGRCAVAWYLSLMPRDGGHVPIVLESVPNDALDPAIAAQNRFEIVVAPHAGDHQLRATFEFDDTSVRATWLVHVPNLEPPTVSLRAGDRQIAAVAGCDLTQRLANDLEEQINACGRDVQREPARRTDLQPGELLTFEIEGWVPTSTYAYCGQLADRRFIPRVEPSCFRERDLQYAGMRFEAPDEVGPWTLAIQACATRLRATGRGLEELCGTWYANVRVRA